MCWEFGEDWPPTLRTMPKSKTMTMPVTLASQSAKLAVRLTKGWVISSVAPMAKMAKKRNAADSKQKEVRTERMKRKVMTPYAKTCASLSKPFSCNGDGIVSWGRWVRKTTVAVQIIAAISHPILKEFLIFIFPSLHKTGVYDVVLDA